MQSALIILSCPKSNSKVEVAVHHFELWQINRLLVEDKLRNDIVSDLRFVENK
jgi:hypothetical protein